MGTTSLSLENFLDPVSKLRVEKWIDLMPSSGTVSSKPISLRISISFTLPTLATRVLHMVRSRPSSKSSCFFPIPGMVQHAKSWARVIDETHSEVIKLQMRDSRNEKAKDNCTQRKQVIGITKSGETRPLADMVEIGWSLMDSHSCLQLKKTSSKEYHIFELIGNRMIKIFKGRKLDYEPKNCEKKRTEEDFMTLVEFSAEDPYGKAIALLDLKTGVIKVKEEWFVLPAIISAFILSNTLKKKGYDDFAANNENLKEVNGEIEGVNGLHEEGVQTNMTTSVETEAKLNMDEANMVHTGGCGSMVNSGGGCGGGCGNMVKSSGCGGGSCGSGCGGGCGGECGNMVKSGGCGGGSCGSGCGGGCGGGCGNMIKSSGCGSGCGGGCGGGCGNMAKSGGCGSGCGGKPTFEDKVDNEAVVA
ncbi:hypothetical protein Pint_27773 [Pistacia integerrima]|uniref:Uncharacterized protein n=1 Tax=Pistacia integerrima TaxID=434235 RepID=A0ACC0YT43_9ROSI|nr:hypothetical protein Pint_27773 [Pistacia integerrima]